MSEEQEKPKTPLFDASAKFKLRRLTPEGIKIIEMAYPSDEDWCARESRRKMIFRTDPATGQEDQVPFEPEEDEAALLQRLCPEIGEIDPYEANRILEQISMLKLVTPEEEIVTNDGLTVSFADSFGCRMTHVFRIPTTRELEKYEASEFSRKAITKWRRSTIRNLRAAADTYASWNIRSEGYAGPVPIVHKFSALFIATKTLRAELDRPLDP